MKNRDGLRGGGIKIPVKSWSGHGRWEAQVAGDKVALLSWSYGGTVAMPVALAVYPK